MSACNIGEKEWVGSGCGQKGKGEGGGSHQNPKPQACVGETRGVQEGVGGEGEVVGGVATSEAASLGARAAEVWPCAPAQLSLSRCRPGDGRRGGAGCGTFKEHAQ